MADAADEHAHAHHHTAATIVMDKLKAAVQQRIADEDDEQWQGAQQRAQLLQVIDDAQRVMCKTHARQVTRAHSHHIDDSDQANAHLIETQENWDTLTVMFERVEHIQAGLAKGGHFHEAAMRIRARDIIAAMQREADRLVAHAL